MSPEYQEYYQELLSTFRSIEESRRTGMERIEACFKSSLDCWMKVRINATQKGFSSEVEEIQFFKEVKPTFTAYIEYYTYRYHALLFCPEENSLEERQFWKWEEKKIERFFENNRDFCVYIEKGDTSRDAEYFLRSSCEPDSGSLVFGLDEGLVSPKDHLVTLLKANRLYEKYVRSIYINQSNLPP